MQFSEYEHEKLNIIPIYILRDLVRMLGVMLTGRGTGDRMLYVKTNDQ